MSYLTPEEIVLQQANELYLARGSWFMDTVGQDTMATFLDARQRGLRPIEIAGRYAELRKADEALAEDLTLHFGLAEGFGYYAGFHELGKITLFKIISNSDWTSLALTFQQRDDLAVARSYLAYEFQPLLTTRKRPEEFVAVPWVDFCQTIGERLVACTAYLQQKS